VDPRRAVQIDQEQLLGHLRGVDPGGAKLFLDVLGDFEVDRHRDATSAAVLLVSLA